jgi:hypothetical protein
MYLYSELGLKILKCGKRMRKSDVATWLLEDYFIYYYIITIFFHLFFENVKVAIFQGREGGEGGRVD